MLGRTHGAFDARGEAHLTPDEAAELSAVLLAGAARAQAHALAQRTWLAHLLFVLEHIEGLHEADQIARHARGMVWEIENSPMIGDDGELNLSEEEAAKFTAVVDAIRALGVDVHTDPYETDDLTPSDPIYAMTARAHRTTGWEFVRYDAADPRLEHVVFECAPGDLAIVIRIAAVLDGGDEGS